MRMPFSRLGSPALSLALQGGGGIERRLARMRWHLIDADEAVGALPSTTRLVPERDFLLRLRDEGRAAAPQWWRGGAFGRRSSVDMLCTFGA